MRRILIHAGMSPMDRPDMDAIFRDRLFTTNCGNLLFQYGAYRTLMTEGAEFTTRFLDRSDIDDAFVDRINAEYDCVALPMANNFRGTYNLKNVTGLVRRLKIPCIVLGIGVQAANSAQLQQGFSFDDSVKEFVSAVLDHSAMLGLRGEMTGDYLKRLGFAPERHFTVIGCPSMYSRGLDLPPVRRSALTPESRVSLNFRKEQAESLYAFMGSAMAAYPDYRIVVQRVEEMLMLRYRVPTVYTYAMKRDWSKPYPHSVRDPSVRAGRVFGYANAQAWLRSMENVDLSVGCRIHGNIAGVLSGAPTLVLTIDTRTEELCRYHNIPFVPADQVNGQTDLAALYERTDFESVHRDHAQRLRHFADFITANGIDHIYREGLSPADVPFDRAMAALPAWGEIGREDRVSLSARRFGAGCIWRAVRGNVGWKLRKMLKK